MSSAAASPLPSQIHSLQSQLQTMRTFQPISPDQQKKSFHHFIHWRAVGWLRCGGGCPLKRAGGCAVPHRSLDGSRPWAQQRNYLYFWVHSFPTAACRFVNHQRNATQRNLEPPGPRSLSQPSGEGETVGARVVLGFWHSDW